MQILGREAAAGLSQKSYFARKKKNEAHERPINKARKRARAV